jgi:hypothetical protein
VSAVNGEDTAPATGERTGGGPVVDVTASRDAEVGGMRVRRALPQRARRTVGAWCFADHFGPTPADHSTRAGIGPHPHIGLHTVTWLVEGELVHRDSLGSEQPVRPGQVNLMTAGHGVSHAEEPVPGHRGALHGIQLWVAQPESTRHGAAAFEHYADLPVVELSGGAATVLVGTLAGVDSPSRGDTAMVGAELRTGTGSTAVPLDPAFEHALVVLDGAVEVGGATPSGHPVLPGRLCYLGLGRDHLELSGASTSLLLGGVPFESPVVMWWNFVGRSREDMTTAADDWNIAAPRFGTTVSSLTRIPAPTPPWRSGRRT